MGTCTSPLPEGDNMVVPEIKRLHSPDVYDLAGFEPEVPDNFGFLLQAMIGPMGHQGEESFDIMVCTPRWLMTEVSGQRIMSGRHYLIMAAYDYARLHEFLVDYCRHTTGLTWKEAATKLSRLGKWEFEDYVEF
jgi:immunity protein 8 of polymorphic toxin system